MESISGSLQLRLPYRSTHPELGDINVILTFSGALPPRRQHTDFITEIASFIRSRREQLGSQDTDFFSWDFSSPLMRSHLQALHLRICPHAIWYCSLAAGFVAMPNFSIEGIVAEKSHKEYRPFDELWLAIQSSTNISEMVITLDGVADFANVPSLDGYCFERVFVLAFRRHIPVETHCRLVQVVRTSRRSLTPGAKIASGIAL